MFYPAIATAALFTAIVVHDAIVKQSSSIATHSFLGLISILAMIYLSMKGADFVAWGILILPMFIIALSFILVYVGTSKAVSPTPVLATTTTTAPAPAATATTVALPASSCSSCNSSVSSMPVSNAPASSSIITPNVNCAAHV